MAGLRPNAANEPFGIVAGGGSLPRLVAEALAQNGWTPVVVLIADARPDEWTGFDTRAFRWGQTGDVFPYLRRHGVAHVAFCGTVSVRPDYKAVWPSLQTLRLLPEIFSIVRGGDDRLLRAVSSAFERRGLQLHAIHEIVPDLLMPLGPITRAGPSQSDLAALRLAAAAAEHLGELDIGQAVVASADRVIALEAAEGTQEMLARVADLRQRGRLGTRGPHVLFKAMKPQQDRRLDLPSIGIATIEQAREAGLSGIGLTAGGALLLGRENIVEAADRAGLFVTGMPPLTAGEDA